jgi:hypothetical protein
MSDEEQKPPVNQRQYASMSLYEWDEHLKRPINQYNSLVAGMTLRDWFAGQALMGLASLNRPSSIAVTAFTIADAMMEERSKT